MSQELPKVLPVFPLTGVLLLPGGQLPLQVFELRYRNMLEDVLESDSMIGIIQPRDQGQPDDVFADDLPPMAAEDEPPPLYDVGCVGHVERCEPLQGSERFFILLRGVCRFRVERELTPRRGYRRVEPDYDDYTDDEETETVISSERIMETLAAFGEGHQVVFELDRLRDLPGLALLNNVAMALPFAPEEKQALLEAPDVEQRLETLLTLMGMGLELQHGQEPQLLN